MKITSYQVKRYPSSIELFIYDEEQGERFWISFDKYYVKTKSDVKEIVKSYIECYGWKPNGKLTEIVDKVFWYIK